MPPDRAEIKQPSCGSTPGKIEINGQSGIVCDEIMVNDRWQVKVQQPENVNAEPLKRFRINKNCRKK